MIYAYLEPFSFGMLTLPTAPLREHFADDRSFERCYAAWKVYVSCYINNDAAAMVIKRAVVLETSFSDKSTAIGSFKAATVESVPKAVVSKQKSSKKKKDVAKVVPLRAVLQGFVDNKSPGFQHIEEMLKVLNSSCTRITRLSVSRLWTSLGYDNNALEDIRRRLPDLRTRRFDHFLNSIIQTHAKNVEKRSKKLSRDHENNTDIEKLPDLNEEHKPRVSGCAEPYVRGQMLYTAFMCFVKRGFVDVEDIEACLKVVSMPSYGAWYRSMIDEKPTPESERMVGFVTCRTAAKILWFYRDKVKPAYLQLFFNKLGLQRYFVDLMS